MKHTTGSIEVITGSMFCGKTDELIRRLRRATIARQKVQVFKPAIDSRYALEKVTSHAGSEYAARPIQHARAMLEQLDPATTVDWLPHLDGYTLAALRGARWLALLTDPRDAFLNWLIHGSLQNYLPAPELGQAADWMAAGG